MGTGLSILIPGVLLVLASRAPKWALAGVMLLFAWITLASWPAVGVGVALGYCLIIASGALLKRGFILAVGAEVLGFWLLSNLGNWWQFFSHDLAGLVACLIAGLPLLAQAALVDGLVAGALWFGVARRFAVT